MQVTSPGGITRIQRLQDLDGLSAQNSHISWRITNAFPTKRADVSPPAKAASLPRGFANPSHGLKNDRVANYAASDLNEDVQDFQEFLEVEMTLRLS
jgi:hypothetical protein